MSNALDDRDEDWNLGTCENPCRAVLNFTGIGRGGGYTDQRSEDSHIYVYDGVPNPCCRRGGPIDLYIGLPFDFQVMSTRLSLDVASARRIAALLNEVAEAAEIRQQASPPPPPLPGCGPRGPQP